MQTQYKFCITFEDGVEKYIFIEENTTCPYFKKAIEWSIKSNQTDKLRLTCKYTEKIWFILSTCMNLSYDCITPNFILNFVVYQNLTNYEIIEMRNILQFLMIYIFKPTEFSLSCMGTFWFLYISSSDEEVEIINQKIYNENDLHKKSDIMSYLYKTQPVNENIFEFYEKKFEIVLYVEEFKNNIFIAGSASLYYFLYQKNGVSPEWVCGDIDIWTDNLDLYTTFIIKNNKISEFSRNCSQVKLKIGNIILNLISNINKNIKNISKVACNILKFDLPMCQIGYTSKDCTSTVFFNRWEVHEKVIIPLCMSKIRHEKYSNRDFILEGNFIHKNNIGYSDIDTYYYNQLTAIFFMNVQTKTERIFQLALKYDPIDFDNDLNIPLFYSRHYFNNIKTYNNVNYINVKVDKQIKDCIMKCKKVILHIFYAYQLSSEIHNLEVLTFKEIEN